MSQFIDLLPVTKSEKAGALVWEPATDAENATTQLAGVLTLTGKRCHCKYAVEEFVSDHGRAFMLFKLGAGSDKTEERYGCVVGAHGVQMCECKGFAFSGSCKHLEAVKTLLAAGQL